MDIKKLLLSDQLNAHDSDFVCKVFEYQFFHNPIFRQWCNLQSCKPENIKHPKQIPFLPVEIFKHQEVITGIYKPDQGCIFKSSTTTSGIPSRHFVADPELYEISILKNFTNWFGPPSDYVFIGLLPGYLERGDASLVYMMECLIRNSGNPQGRLFHSAKEAAEYLLKLQDDKKYLVLGVTYSMLDLASLGYDFDAKEILFVETGGMKGKRKELSRSELHETLRRGLKTEFIYSEYGMTELLSQAWTNGRDDYFCPPPWMKFYVRDVADPFAEPMEEGRGQLLIVDITNIHSCCFLATQDLAELGPKGMRLLGRTDFSEIRGCNLMYGTTSE
ncbi:MAG: acyl transferase [Bacteroidia bacterium]|nr:acyl transferase [Bacteroidia bacterium]